LPKIRTDAPPGLVDVCCRCGDTGITHTIHLAIADGAGVVSWITAAQVLILAFFCGGS
jgi:hypothetical protein